jgi:hypothetical protein
MVYWLLENSASVSLQISLGHIFYTRALLSRGTRGFATQWETRGATVLNMVDDVVSTCTLLIRGG